LLAVAIVVLAGCGDDDDDGSETAPTVTGPAPSEGVTAGAYADEWNGLSESLDVATVDNELPSTQSGNWQLRLDVEASDADEGWALMQNFAEQFGCSSELPARQPRDDMLVVSC
jgi:hypothetical protein